MPSFDHDFIVELFRAQPRLAPDLMTQGLGMKVPAYAEARVESAELTDLAPAQYRADLVVVLTRAEERVLAIVVELQLAKDPQKRFSWPMYAVGLRARLGCPACVLVVAPNPRVAAWAAKPIELGPGGVFTPVVMSFDHVPRVTDLDVALADPELALLSVLAHARRDPAEEELIARHALASVARLDDGRQGLYSDVVLSAVSEATRIALEEAMANGNYVFRSDFAKKHQAIGRAEGRQEGREEGREEGRIEAVRASVLGLLEERGLRPTDDERAAIAACTDEARLGRLFRRAVTAPSVAAVLAEE